MSSILLPDVDTLIRPDRHLQLVPDLPLAASLQLTRRGRVAVLVAALLTLAVLVVTLGSSTTATGDAGSAAPTHTVTVEPGDTLWKLATEANPRGDIRQTVDDIMRLNSLPSGGGLQMGSEIAVPIYE